MGFFLSFLGIFLGYYDTTIKNNNDILFKLLTRYYEYQELIEAKKYIEKYSNRMNDEAQSWENCPDSNYDFTVEDSIVYNDLKDKLLGNSEFNINIDDEARRNVDLLIFYYIETINICGKGAASLIESLDCFRATPGIDDYIEKHYPMEKVKFELFCKRYRYATFTFLSRLVICWRVAKKKSYDNSRLCTNENEARKYCSCKYVLKEFLSNFLCLNGLGEIKIKYY